jgi:hypothetical protein
VATGIDLGIASEVLRELQRSCREEPFFAERFGSRDTGFRAACSGVKPDAISVISREQVEWTWLGLCELLRVSPDVDVADVDDLLDLSEEYHG